MAGRGRGRGRGLSFNIENLGIGRGEAIAGANLLPPATFPALEFHPMPLTPGDDYVVQLKQDFRTTMQESPFFVRPSVQKKDITRYSDKYQIGQQDDLDWCPVWSRLPTELNPKKRRKVRSAVAPNIPLKKPKKVDVKAISEKLKLAAKEDGKEDQEEDDEEEKEDEAAPEEEVYEEEELEDDTDYNQTYFDNGENFGADEEDDLEEGPVY